MPKKPTNLTLARRMLEEAIAERTEMLLFHAKHVTGEHWGVETFLMRELPVLVQAREEIASEQWSWKMKTVSDELRQRVIGILTAPGFLGLPIIKLDEKKDFFDGPRFLELLS